MLDPANDLLPPTSSPTNSSISSSDLDTESTGSFFHDRSTTLGTLMGVSFPAITLHRETHLPSTAGGTPASRGGGRKTKKQGKKRVPAAAAAAEGGGRWWRLCRDDGAESASLGEFLEVERRFGDGAFYGAAELEELVANQARNGRLLFADGRVLPPAEVEEGTSAGALCRFPVSLTGICSGGVG